ncbi:MAG: serine hydrolase, partial [Acidimicrobiales bacterium]
MSGLVALPPQPPGVPWPAGDWPEGELPPAVDLGPLLEQAFDDEGPLATTFAVLVVHGGKVVAERYHGALEHFDREPTPVTAGTPLLSWSMAKSMLHAVVGLLVGDGRLDLDAPAAVPEWSAPDDPRHAITLRQLLAMRDGLDFVEDYVDDRVSDVMHMLFGEGQTDMAHFAADRPLAAVPGSRFNYSSGTSNIISGVVARTVGPGEDYARFLHGRLFGPVGMTSADPEFDEAGTWVASSYVRATARDFARFGLLYL